MNNRNKEILEDFKTSMDGLTTKEAAKRLEKYGYNELPKEEIKPLYKVFLGSFKDPIIYVLIVCAILSFIVGETLDGLAILFIIMVDAIVSTIQEYKANKNSEALKNLIKVNSKVMRDGKQCEIDSSLVVPGDILILESGSKISADARIIESNNLTVDESILTGESIAVNKSSEISQKDLTKCSLYAGCSVLTGRAAAVVSSTGINTEVGKIAQKVTTTEESLSPLTIRMEKFSKQITLIIVVIAVIIAIILFKKDYEPLEIFLAVVALSVSAMPEGLPLALTMALTIGSNKMSKRNVICKKLTAVESLGSCTVIASDKTGTLTVNEQTAKKIVLPDGKEYNVTGNGYNDIGKVEGKNINDAKYIAKLGYINNEAKLEKVKDHFEKLGDSIDVAFLSLAYKLDCNIDDIFKVQEIPYESEKKYSAVYYKKDNEIYCTAKGSVEEIIEFCSHSYVSNKKVKLNKEEILKQNEALARNGYRVIALCDGKVKSKKYDDENIKNLNFIGLVGFVDPVRKEVASSIKECTDAGIKVLMITGDHALTAYSIAKELKLVSDYSEVITGEELEFCIDDEEFDECIKNKKVFARVTPLQKLKIVESLQRMGEFVAVTGDGVNDAPAIKAANIGVAMGSGTDVAKETANMIIIDDNFTSIVAGIEEGRNAYSNIRKISILLLSCGFAEVIFFVLAILFNLPMPLVAIQLLWLNLVTDGLQDLALSFERETDTIMKQKPRKTNESLFEKEMVKQILASGLFMGIIVFDAWFVMINFLNFEVAHARGYILALMVFMQNIHVLNCRSEEKSVFKNGFKQNSFVLITIVSTIILQIIVMEVPVLSSLLQTYSVPYSHMIILLLLALPVLLIIEIYKYRRRNNK